MLNGGRTRNLPHHAPDKWVLFKEYNKRDVEVEMSIKEKLHKFPVPEFVWEEYHLDQVINDRGILVDMQLVENAIAFDERSKADISLLPIVRFCWRRRTGTFLLHDYPCRLHFS